MGENDRRRTAYRPSTTRRASEEGLENSFTGREKSRCGHPRLGIFPLPNAGSESSLLTNLQLIMLPLDLMVPVLPFILPVAYRRFSWPSWLAWAQEVYYSSRAVPWVSPRFHTTCPISLPDHVDCDISPTTSKDDDKGMARGFQ